MGGLSCGFQAGTIRPEAAGLAIAHPWTLCRASSIVAQPIAVRITRVSTHKERATGMRVVATWPTNRGSPWIQPKFRPSGIRNRVSLAAISGCNAGKEFDLIPSVHRSHVKPQSWLASCTAYDGAFESHFLCCKCGGAANGYWRRSKAPRMNKLSGRGRLKV
ncbi:hypothetical protein BDV06DRAFT_133656 [Aspergillus oleicola]